jgi:nucleoside-diphosphate-sugar epimerase
VGERLVLAANGGPLATTVLRPHLLIGPGDRTLLPRVVEKAARGALRIVGDGKNRVDLTFIDNAAWAHLDAGDALARPAASCAGRSYFISNGEPVVLWDWLNRLLRDLGIPSVSRRVSRRAAHAVGTASEVLWRLLRLRGEPPITRFLADALARSHWYDLGPATRDFGYRVRVPMEEATRLTIDGLRRERRTPASVSREVPA